MLEVQYRRDYIQLVQKRRVIIYSCCHRSFSYFPVRNKSAFSPTRRPNFSIESLHLYNPHIGCICRYNRKRAKLEESPLGIRIRYISTHRIPTPNGTVRVSAHPIPLLLDLVRLIKTRF